MHTRQRPTVAPALLAAAAASLFAAQLASANTGTHLPLNQIQAGTEQTTLVPNGNFENGSTNWVATGDIAVGTPVNTGTQAAVFGNGAAKMSVGTPIDNDPDQFAHVGPFTFDQTKSYVISAYLWNWGAGAGDQADTTLAELRSSLDPAATVRNVALEPIASDPAASSGANGVFAYAEFKGSDFPAGAILLAKFDSTAFGAGNNGLLGQVDNIAITLASDFRAPLSIPEPAALGALGTAALAAIRRRR